MMILMKTFIWILILGIASITLLFAAFIVFGVYVVATRLGMPTIEPNLASFWLGLWQGLIVILSFVTSLFDQNITLYQVGNTGFWYNLGYLFGLSISLGGTGKVVSKD